MKSFSERRQMFHFQSNSGLFLYTAFGLVVFTVAWGYTTGGYICSLSLFLCLFVYAYGRSLLSRAIFKELFANSKANLIHWFQHDRRSLMLMVSYIAVKLLILSVYPQRELSNGSPLSLILFTVFFLIIFIAPAILQSLTGFYNVATNSFIQKLQRQTVISMKYSKIDETVSQTQERDPSLISTLYKWRKSTVIILALVILSYIMDGDITCIVRYIGKGTPCWPLLIPGSMRDTLPYPLQHAWFQRWHRVFHGYQPSSLVLTALHYVLDMELIHLLPVLIGTFVLSQILLPKKYLILKKTLFGCIAGVVLSGVTAVMLKLAFHRYRPNAYGNPYMWKGPSTTYVNHLSFSKLDLSFPAGHTTITSVISTCLYLSLTHSYKNLSQLMNVWLVCCLYVYPCVVLVSRVSDCYHWTSDATFGMFLGYVIGNAVMYKLLRSVEHVPLTHFEHSNGHTAPNNTFHANGHVKHHTNGVLHV